jgi:hypothetical protein
MLPFTPEQFFSVFTDYNNAIWPIQIVANLLGGIAVAFLFGETRKADMLIAGSLAAMWLWTGVGYHAISFSAINNAAFLFAALFIVQGFYFIYAGVYHHQLRFGVRWSLATGTGAALLVYAAILYPLIGVATGHRYPAMPTFGVTPCPVTIFTFGMLLLTIRPVPRWLLVIPFVWSLIGGTAAILLNVPQDWLLLVSGCIAAPLVVFRDRQTAQSVRAA